MIQNQEFIQEFVDEAKSHIEKVEAALLDIKTLNDDSEMINDLFRAVHSIKGTAGFFGLKKIVSLAHAMENVFGEVRNGRFTISEDVEELFLEANDCIKEMVDDVLSSEDKDVSALVNRLNALLEKKDETAEEKVQSNNIVIVSENRPDFNLNGSPCELIKDGLKHGHKIYEIKLQINRDLMNYNEGPVKLFKKMEFVGMVVDTIIDYSEINTLDDVLEAVENRTKDVYLGILVTTVLERDLLAEAVGVPIDKIFPLQVDQVCSAASSKSDSEQSENPPQVEKVKKETETEGPKKAEVNQNSSVEIQNKDDKASKQLKIDDSIRVHVSILNDLLDMAGEMVLGRNQLLRTLENYRKTIPGLAPILQNIDRLTTGVQEKVMMTRMQPVANVFNKFPRIIRDISKSLSKDIELVIEGADVELDKSMIEALADPLTHLVRNAADHGIEVAEVRQQLGKPRSGKIILRAYHEGGYVNIDIIDDGKGMDAEKIRKAALQKEVISANELEHLSEQDVLKLIFKPGFSTAEKVSDISGRGVGMDVVRTNIERLGGSIELFTTKGMGSTIRLMLPLTLAIIQSLIVEVAGRRFALPQVNLKEIVRIRKGDADNRIEYLHNAEVLRLRGRLLPIIHLSEVLGIEKMPNKKISEEDDQNISADDSRDIVDVTRVLVLKIGNRMFGIMVDSILGREETLVKPLPIYLKNCNCYSGVTILGDGKTSMILDPEGIIRLTDLKFREDDEQDSEHGNSADSELTEYQNLLLFNCSGNEIFALDLAVVARIKEINATDIELVGDKEFITFNGQSLRVIRPEDYLPVSKNNHNPDKYNVIIPKLVSHPIGILIQKIHDNINTRIHLNTDDVVTEGLVGSAIYNNRMILIINIYELFEKADPEHYQVERKQVADNQRVLLVEDTQFFQRIELKYLEEAGYQPVLAQNGQEALDYLDNEKFDIVVSDVHMPVMDGFKLIRRIRQNPAFEDLPVIALTSMTDEVTKQTVLESGFDYYEWKLNRDNLLKTMEQALRKGGNKVD